MIRVILVQVRSQVVEKLLSSESLPSIIPSNLAFCDGTGGKSGVRFLADSAEALPSSQKLSQCPTFSFRVRRRAAACLLAKLHAETAGKSILHNSSHFHFHIILVVTSTRVQSIGPEVSVTKLLSQPTRLQEFGG